MRRAFFALLLIACTPKEFHCVAARECIDKEGGPGLCLDTHCAFEDPQCATGYRFDDTAGGQANDCVTASQLPSDAGAGDAAEAPDGAPMGDAGSADAAETETDAAGPADAGEPDAAPADAATPDASG